MSKSANRGRGLRRVTASEAATLLASVGLAHSVVRRLATEFRVTVGRNFPDDEVAWKAMAVEFGYPGPSLRSLTRENAQAFILGRARRIRKTMQPNPVLR